MKLTTIIGFVLALMALTAAPALGATVSGTIKNGKNHKVLLVQANGASKRVTITSASGAFAIRGVRLHRATLQLVNPDGSYYGPVVLKSTSTKAYSYIRGKANLRIGAATLKGGYARLNAAPAGRFMTLAVYTAKARSGRPIGARKLGRVRTGAPTGYRGAAGDLDLDGIASAFDIDDNGNLILDNIDRSGRGAKRPDMTRLRATNAVASPANAVASIARAGDDPPPPPPPGDDPKPPTNEFWMFSNFKVSDPSSINVNIPGITDVDGLIEDALPRVVTLATQVIGGGSATLDGLGNSYLLAHDVDGVPYPHVNDELGTFTGTSLNLSTGIHGDAQIRPGALPDEIGAGDTFLETTPDGIGHPGVLNFVFNTIPALKSYQFDTDASPTQLVYDASGETTVGMSPDTPIIVPAGASELTVTVWRPQRQATSGEVGNAQGWIDIGGLGYNIDVPDSARASEWGPELPGTHNATGAYSNATANGTPITLNGTEEQVPDPVGDAPASAANTITFTVSFTETFSEWVTYPSGAFFRVDIQARSLYGDNAARGLWFELE